ncbi:MAG: hypothetical protein MR765_07560 [Tenericutes bacterium]|nr:hypothetical protein [Mycoplasmatota bacterium]
MDLFVRFLYDFLTLFFEGLKKIFLGLFTGIMDIFNLKRYYEVIKFYSEDLSTTEWILVILAALCVLIILGTIIFLVYLLIRKYIRLRKSLVEQEELLEEVANLNRDVLKLTQEKDKILAMKVSQLGLKPNESNIEDIDGINGESNNEMLKEGESRFSKLSLIDEEYKDYVVEDYHNTFTLPELCEKFRNFAASKLGLYYKIDLVRLFVSAIASTRLVILQGISGTGKTSLAYAWGKFLKNDSTIASVQPSWRDRTELFGYFNEFTKKFNETDVLKKMYQAGYDDRVYITVLDEMNIARVEYYFAEMLSILEMPSRDEWVIEMVSSSWPNDPKKLIDGKLKIPGNMWYVGTINNDDSTFMVTDKVYDRAMPIDINDKGQVFNAPVTDAMDINSSYLEKLFTEAKANHPIKKELLDKIEAMDNYVIAHFRIAFGNRIVKHMKDFVPVYVACGGKETDAIDYFIARKILRKFEQLNLSYIRDEIDGFVKFLDTTFGKDVMHECKEYVLRLKKLV